MSIYDREWYRYEHEDHTGPVEESNISTSDYYTDYPDESAPTFSRSSGNTPGHKSDAPYFQHKQSASPGKTILTVIMIVLFVATWKTLFSGGSPTQSSARTNDLTGTNAGANADLYDLMLNNLSAHKKSFSLTNTDSDVIKSTYRAICDDHPELFWLSGGSTLTTMTTNGNTVVLFQPWFYEIDDIEQKEAKLNAVIQSVLDQIPPGLSPYQKVVLIHDFIVSSTDYDMDAYNDHLRSGPVSAQYACSYTSYGCLVNRRAVCEGYSKAFQLFMNALDIRCGRVTGSKIGGGEHTWNYVTLDSESYYVDVTWDDTVSTGEPLAVCSHAYFCIPAEELLKTHTLDEDQYIPSCTSSDLDYYRLTGMFIENDNLPDAVRLIAENRGSPAVEIKFSSLDLKDYFVKQLFENGSIYRYPAFEGVSGLRYSSNPTSKILTIYYS